jgi:hypothetical protein
MIHGNNFSLDKKTVIKTLSLDTNFIQDTENIFKLPETLNNVVSMKITGAVIPITWYDISDTNNKLDILIHYVDVNTAEYTKSIIVPKGNYTSTELVLLINHLIGNNSGNNYVNIAYNDKSSSMFFHFTTDNVTPTVDYYTVTFPLSSTGVFNHRTHLGTILGFDKNEYSINTLITNDDIIYSVTDDAISATTYKNCVYSDFKYNLKNKLTYAFIEIDDYVKNSTTDVISSFSANYKKETIECNYKCRDNTTKAKILERMNIGYNFLSKNIIASINITKDENGIVFSDNTNSTLKQRTYFGPVKIEKLKINLIDKYGNKLDAINSMFSCVLEFEQIC